MLVSASFSNESEIMRRGYGILPRGLSLESYGLVFKNPDAILRSYQVTIFVTAAGTLSALLFMSMAAYALSAKRFKWRNKISFFFFFTTLFNGGVVPWYILMVQYLRLKNNILALILPHLLNVFYLLILRSFFSTIPDAISESARIDGAGEFRIYAQLILPLAVPSLVTICLFVALYYWNDWYLSMMFISKQELYSLQYSLYRILSSVEGMKLAISKGANVNVSILPIETLKNSMAVVATGPILLLYPFLQRYFIKGLTIGAVKG
jgi:putative aldouronate transport system permease protein